MYATYNNRASRKIWTRFELNDKRSSTLASAFAASRSNSGYIFDGTVAWVDEESLNINLFGKTDREMIIKKKKTLLYSTIFAWSLKSSVKNALHEHDSLIYAFRVTLLLWATLKIGTGKEGEGEGGGGDE